MLDIEITIFESIYVNNFFDNFIFKCNFFNKDLPERGPLASKRRTN